MYIWEYQSFSQDSRHISLSETKHIENVLRQWHEEIIARDDYIRPITK